MAEDLAVHEQLRVVGHGADALDASGVEEGEDARILHLKVDLERLGDGCWRRLDSGGRGCDGRRCGFTSKQRRQ